MSRSTLASTMVAALMGSALTASAFDVYELDEATRSSVRENISGMLKEPASADFGAIKAVQRPGGDIMICGTVNAANSFGGKTGKLPFIFRLWPGSSELYLEELAKDAGDAPRIQYLCQNAGALI